MAKGLTRKDSVLDLIREDLDTFIGQPVTVRANRGRKRVVEIDGVLERTYPKIFVIASSDRNLTKRLSYTYSDVLTRSIEVRVNGDRVGYTD